MNWLDTLALFRWTIAAALLCGLVLPLLGAFLLLRRSGFHGLVLPQVATAGVALGYAILPWWIAHIGFFGLNLEEALADPHGASSFMLLCAALATAVALLAMRGPREVPGATGLASPESARQAAWFAGAWGATILLGSSSPIGTEWIDGLLRGELLSVDVHGIEVLLLAFGPATYLLLHRWRQLTLASLDPTAAEVLGLAPRRRELEFALALGLATATSAVIVGPLVGFALLVLPPLGAHRWARSLTGFLIWSLLLGLLTSITGLALAFALDLPIGASLAASGALLCLALRLAPNPGRQPVPQA
jgi:zinc transport system permease protein